MSTIEKLNAADPEEWFLVNAEKTGAEFTKFRSALESMRRAGAADKAEVCADLLMECLVKRGDVRFALDLLRLRASWHGAENGFSSSCETTLHLLFDGSPNVVRFIPHLGFDRGVPPVECLRRLDVLRGLSPGVLCYDATWRLGVLREIDAHTKQFVIDFRTRPGHRMSFAYAAERLVLIGSGHVLAEQHADPAAFARRVQEDPGGVVKSFIRDFGPMNVAALQELILANTDAITQWKEFWGKARKQLKNDARVVIPAKRAEPIRILEETDSPEDHWISSLQVERNPKRIIELIEELKAAGNIQAMPESSLEVLRKSIDSVLAIAGPNEDALKAQALLLLNELGLERDPERTNALIEELLRPTSLEEIIRRLPVRATTRLIPFLARRRPDTAEALFLDIMSGLELQHLGIVIDALLALGREAEVVARLRLLAMRGSVRIETVAWLCRNLEFVFRNAICSPSELVCMTLSAIEAADATGASPRARNMTRNCFQNDEWLTSLTGALDETQRRDLFVRIKMSKAWKESERNMLMARLSKLFPELRQLVSGAPVKTAPPRLTSYRSYAERQAVLRKLVAEDIPKNIQDIAAARSFGDLSENYEYHAAREAQGMLMERRKELERLLAEVSGTAFENASRDKVGMGTFVTLRLENGETERYAILGEWDYDERLGIISSLSGLAQLLAGHKVGDEVLIPKETGDARCVIADISELPDEIRKWIRSTGNEQPA